MFVSSEWLTITQDLGIATLVFAVLTLLGFALKWGIRFQLVGVTGFCLVLVAGSFGLSLGLFQRVEIPGATPYTLVYDMGNNRAVITVEKTLDPDQLAATLKQAAYNVFSPGRFSSVTGDRMVIQARVLTHPEPGVTQPIYVGQVERSLSMRDDEDMVIQTFDDRLAQVQSSPSS